MTTENASHVLAGISVLYVASSSNYRAVGYSIYHKNIIHCNPWRVNRNLTKHGVLLIQQH
jgi:hypothetical protein